MAQYLTQQVTHDNDQGLQVRIFDRLDAVNDSVSVYPKCIGVNLAASALVRTGAGSIIGILINSHTSGTIKLWDNTAASGTVITETITLNVGERYIPLEGETFATGLYVTIGGTANITVLYNII